MQWEMKKCQKGCFSAKENRIAAIKWLVKKLEMDPNDLKYEHFKDNRLGGLLRQGGYNGSIHKAICEAYPELEAGRKGMHHVSEGFAKKKIKPEKHEKRKENACARPDESTSCAEISKGVHQNEKKTKPDARERKGAGMRLEENSHSAPHHASKGIAKKETKPEKREKAGGNARVRLDSDDYHMLADMDRAFGGGRAAGIFSLPRETSKRPFNLDSIEERARARKKAPDERKWSPETLLLLQEGILAEERDTNKWILETRNCMRYCRELLVMAAEEANVKLTVKYGERTCFPWTVANGNGSPVLRIDIQYDKGTGTYFYGEERADFRIREDLDRVLKELSSLLASQQDSN